MDINIDRKEFQEIHSDELNEIINKPPHWIVRSGMFVFCGLLIVALVAAWKIKYPDIVTASFTLTAYEAPRNVIIRTEGKLTNILVKDGQSVSIGQVLAYIESTGDHIQILELEQKINNLDKLIQNHQWSQISNTVLPSHSRIGQIQEPFQALNLKLNELKTILDNGFYQKKRRLLLEDIQDLQELSANLEEQLTLQQKNFNLAKEDFNVQERLYNDKVIARMEFNKERTKVLDRELPLKAITSNIIQNTTLQKIKKKEILELDNTISEKQMNFRQEVQSLLNAIENWKYTYILTAPVSGKISFFAPWQNQQYMKLGQEFLTVEPKGENFQGF